MYPGRQLQVFLDGDLVAAVRTKTASLQRQALDETDGELNGWQRFNPTPESRSMTVACDGIASRNNWTLLDTFFDESGELSAVEVALPDEAAITSEAFLRSLEYQGEVAGMVIFSAVLEISSEISVTQAPEPEPPIPTEPITRIYLANDTWEKPAGLVSLDVYVVGAGGGGGSGANRAGGQSGAGGAGGGGGGYSSDTLTAAELGDTESVVIGSGGAGGSSQVCNTSGETGLNGSAGTASSFGAHASANGGQGGEGGREGILSIATDGGDGGTGDIAGGNGAGTVSGQSNAGGSSTRGGAGGACGSGYSGNPVYELGAAGGSGDTAGETNAGGAGGASVGADGDDGTQPTVYTGGGGAGGGGVVAELTTPGDTGGDGGDGALGGGGGGGGMATFNGSFDPNWQTTGRGGNGGNGFVVVIENYPTS